MDIDGAGLACGVFEYLLSLGENRPKVLGATHFHEIFENGFLPQRPSLAFGHMEIRLEQKAVDWKDQITHLYTYELHTTSKKMLTEYKASTLAGVH